MRRIFSKIEAGFFRFFAVAVSGELSLEGVILKAGRGDPGVAIFNSGITSLRDSIVTDSNGDGGTILNDGGTLNLLRSIVTQQCVGA